MRFAPARTCAHIRAEQELKLEFSHRFAELEERIRHALSATRAVEFAAEHVLHTFGPEAGRLYWQARGAGALGSWENNGPDDLRLYQDGRITRLGQLAEAYEGPGLSAYPHRFDEADALFLLMWTAAIRWDARGIWLTTDHPEAASAFFEWADSLDVRQLGLREFPANQPIASVFVQERSEIQDRCHDYLQIFADACASLAYHLQWYANQLLPAFHDCDNCSDPKESVPVEAKPTAGHSSTCPTKNDWRTTRRQLLIMMDRGEPCTTLEELMERTNSTLHAVRRAISESNDLTAWRERSRQSGPTAAPRPVRLEAAVFNRPQTREPAPLEFAELAEQAERLFAETSPAFDSDALPPTSRKGLAALEDAADKLLADFPED